MSTLRHLLLSATFATLLTSCTATQNDNLVLAEDEYAAGRYESARQLCREIADNDSTDNVTVNRLCRLAMLNAKLAEHFEDDANIASATRYMHRAMQRDSDSVAIFIKSLEIEERSLSALISQLTRAIDTH